MFVLFVIVISATVWGFLRQPTGFLPTEDQGYAILLTRLPAGASLPRSQEVANKIDGMLGKIPGVEHWVTIGGYSLLDGANVVSISSTFIIFEDWEKRGSNLPQGKIVASIYHELAELQEAQAIVVIPPPIRGLGQTGGFQMMVEDRASLGLDELQQAAMEITQAGNSQPNLQGLVSTFNVNNPQLYLDIDRTKAESLQVPLENVFGTLQAYLGSSFVNLFNRFNQVFQVYIQAGSQYRLEPRDIKNLHVRNKTGEMVPLGTLLDVRQVLGPELVTRYNLYPAATLFGSATTGFSSGQALSLMEQLAQGTLPHGMAYEWTSTSYQEKKVGNQAYFIYALSIILVYLVLAALYESWTYPGAIILVVPIALVGVLISLMVRGFENDLYTQVGLVLMIALASKNAILVVEFARELHQGGMAVSEAAIEATRRRFRPIVMTSLAFIAGVVPLLVAFGAGSASQRAIGTVVFGGMIASTLVAIPFVPVFYVLLDRMAERIRRKKT